MSKPEFKHLGKQGFPHADGVNVYKYDNDFDYSRYDFDQMKITICSVPWDMGEAHIGNRTIDGVGNVVYFDSAEKRDEWFANIPDAQCFRWESRYKELHKDMKIAVPLPFDVVSRYNYVFVEYMLFANDDSPVEYESADGVRKWCYFIRNVTMQSANTSELELMEDVWQTFIYDFNITNMILERGHAPAFATKADAYLASPIDNCENLLTEDANFGELQRVTKSQATALNAENMKACIVTTANVADTGAWNDRTPGLQYNVISGVPALSVFALEPGKLIDFLINVDSQAPQFKQTVQAVFFAESSLLSLGDAFTFAGVSCNLVMATNTISKEAFSRTKADWAYSARYADLAKLYTFPYSALEVTDDHGDTELVKIEDTANVLTLDVALNAVFPYVQLSGVLRGIGGNVSNTVKFSGIGERSFTGIGRWYEHLRNWDVPTFSITLDASTEYGYSTKFDRAQMENDRATDKAIGERDTEAQYDIASATAHTNFEGEGSIAYERAAREKLNAQRSNDAQLTMTKRSATNVTDNANAQITQNDSNATASTSAASTDAYLQNELQRALTNWSNGYTDATVNTESDAAVQSAAVSAVSSVANGAVGGAVSGAAAGGAVGAAIGAVGGLVSGGISAATTGINTAISINANQTQAENTKSYAEAQLSETQQSNTDRTNNSNTATNAQKDAANVMTQTSAANTVSTMNENAATLWTANDTNATTREGTEQGIAGLEYSLATSNAATSRDTAKSDVADNYVNAGNRIQNLVNQAALRGPSVFGSVSNAELAQSRPMALFVNIVTQSKSAIKQAGDEFLRYGYRLEQRWDFDGNWNIGEHFTYWKLRDYWVQSNNMQDYYQDAIRFFLMGGVTVWRKPEDIGAVSIYDNGI